MVEGAIINTWRGMLAEASAMARTPAAPQTFAISWGSAATVVVPQARTSSANRAGAIILLSMCIWASMKPGTA